MKKLLCFILMIIICVGTVGCKTEEKSGFRIVTSFYPMYISVLNITDGAENVSVVNMAGQQAGCLHDYQLQSKDIKALEKADVFVINGGGMENFLDKVTDQLPALSVVDASEGITLTDDNPHIWVSLSGCISQVENIAEGLMRADPENSDIYRENAKKYTEKISALRDEIKDSADTFKSRQIVTMHEAFPYFAEEFGLEIVGVVNREPDSEPAAKEIAGTIDLINELGVKAVFAEPQYSASAASIIAGESCADVYFLDPVVTGREDKDAYLDAMRENLEQLEKALK